MTIAKATKRVASALEAANLKVVFAESCTGGLVSGALTQVPGISAHHCGGVVVYRNETKQTYLHVPTRLLKTPGPVSAIVTKYLAQAVLEKTPEADLAIAITGHLGPNAPPRLDGQVFIAVAWRRDTGKRSRKVQVHPFNFKQFASRTARQHQAVESALEFLAQSLEAHAR